MPEGLSLCPLCGKRLVPIDDIPDEVADAAKRHCAEKTPPHPDAWLHAFLRAMAGIPLALLAGIGACIFWFVINTGVTLGPTGTGPFLMVTAGIFGVAFMIVMGAWLAALGIWPFRRE